MRWRTGLSSIMFEDLAWNRLRILSGRRRPPRGAACTEDPNKKTRPLSGPGLSLPRDSADQKRRVRRPDMLFCPKADLPQVIAAMRSPDT